MQALKNKIVKGLREHLGFHVVPTDTAGQKPEYPYLSYKITSSLENNGGFNLIDHVVPSDSPDFEYDIETTRSEQAQFSLSVSAYSNDEDEACRLAIRAADWFKFTGYAYLKDCNVIVVNVSNVSDRAIQIVDDYERRYGFDVRCRAARSVTKRVETIEQYSFQNKTNE